MLTEEQKQELERHLRYMYSDTDTWSILYNRVFRNDLYGFIERCLKQLQTSKKSETSE